MKQKKIFPLKPLAENLLPYLLLAIFLGFSLLLGLHITYVSSAFFAQDTEIHKETMNFLFLGKPFSIEMTQHEFIHMVDVRNLFLLSHTMLFMFILLATFSFWYCKRKQIVFKPKHHFFGYCFFVTFLISVLFFQEAFYVFHRIFFTNDYWLFPNESLFLIAYPATFFIWSFGTLLVSSTILYVSLTYGVSLKKKHV